MIFHASEMGLVSKEEVLERIEKGMEERGGEETKGPIGHHPMNSFPHPKQTFA